MGQWFSALLDACFPPTCPFCDVLYAPTLIAPVCATCAAATQWLRAPVTAAAVPDASWNSVRALCRFEGPIVDAIHRLKYERRPDLAPALGRLVTELAFDTSPHDCVVPVPLARRRLTQRGYNQAQLIARPLAVALRAAQFPAVLERVRETPAQVGLSAVERQVNVRGAFAVASRYRAQVRGRRCLLVDDVMTTGATLAACTAALRRAGARQVHALVLAVA